MNKEEFDQQNVFGKGEPNTGFSQYFIGNSYLNPLTEVGKSHIHHATKGGGQILICTAGYGFYQEENCPVRKLQPGDVVVIPANVKHWHGATKGSWFSHISVEVLGENTSNEWLEPVRDEEYNKLS